MAIQQVNLPAVYGAAQNFRQGQQQNALLKMQMDQARQQAETQNKLRPLVSQALGGNRDVLPQIGELSPDTAMNLRTHLDSLDAAERERMRAEAPIMARALQNATPQNWGMVRSGLQRFGVDVSDLPPVMDQRGLETLRQTAQMFMEPGEGFTLSPGEQRFDAAGRPIAQVAPSTDEGPIAFGPVQTDPDTGVVYQDDSRGQRHIIREPDTRDQNPFTIEKQLRGEFNGLPEVKAFKEIIPAVRSARETLGRDTRAADINLVFAVGKTFDPTSVVREGEQIVITSATSPANQISGYINYLQGGGRLTSAQRQELIAELNSRYGAWQAQYQAAADRYSELATTYGGNPQNVIAEIGLPSAQDTGGGGAAGPDASNFPGLVEQGNIDLASRPVVRNPDGSISTVRSMSINVDGLEVLIPTVSEDGRVMSDQEAIETFRRTGRHLGKFRSVEAANRYAEQLHNAQDRFYSGGGQEAQAENPYAAMTNEEILADLRRKGYIQ